MKATVVVVAASIAPACSFSILPASTLTVKRWDRDVTVARSLTSPTTRRCATLAPHSAPPGDWDATFFSPSKINLFLRVIGKRPDGFHDLASLFQTVGFGDDLYFERLPKTADQDEFECNMDGVPTDRSNLVLRALDLFRRKTTNEDYYKVYLNKRVPPEAGLGGGSANAATALFAANELAARPASLTDLQLWSGELGSDITFFLSTGTCYCTGRGEILHPQQPMPQARVWLVKPRGGLSTPVVFRHLDYDLLSSKDPEQLLRKFIQHGVTDAEYVNDLELPAFRAMPSLQQMKVELERLGFQHVLMSGSGSTIFCVGNPSNAGDWTDEFAKKWGAMVVDTCFINRPSGQGWYTRTSH